MPRGVKGSGKTTARQPRQKKGVPNYALQIIDKEQEIQALKDKISEIQKDIKDLTALKNKEDADTLLQAVLSSGITVEEALSSLTRSKIAN
jgi:hypothetical protein